MTPTAPESATGPASPTRSGWGWLDHPVVGPGLVFLLTLGILGPLFQRLPVLYDTDSYYHLAIARAYARHGIIDSLPWAQLSLLHTFADKELLFHLALAPLADGAHATAGGRLALALLNALIATVIALLGSRLVGRWGLLLPVLVYVGSLPFLGRMIRLRPELLSLLLLLVAVACMAQPSRPRNQRLLGLVALLYTLSYTAFHAFLGLCGLWFLARVWLRRRVDWGLVLYPLVGAGLALVLHPHFPHNLAVWKIQSFDFFAEKGRLNVGSEIEPQTTAAFLLDNAGWWLALLALALAGQRGRPASAPGKDRRASRQEAANLADALWVAVLAFGGLHLLMQRFVIYSVPLATLAVVAELRRRGLSLGTVRLPGRGRLPLALALAIAVTVGLPPTVRLLGGLAKAQAPVSREADWQALGQALPPGARVAAEWGSTHLYMFWAPHAMFLNVLDPVFMKVPFPEAHTALRNVFEGREPDIPRMLRQALRSDHIALSRFHEEPSVLRRLAADPRLEKLHDGYTQLYRLRDDANRAFVLDWLEVPDGGPEPPSLEALNGLLLRPRSSEPALRAIEGYVDTERDDRACQWLVHPLRIESETLHLYELAPYGPTQLWLDDRLVVSTGGTPGAILGQGLAIPLTLTPGLHRLTVSSCPGSPSNRSGFYLLRRG